MLTADKIAWRDQFQKDGYVVLRGLVPDSCVQSAKDCIDSDIAHNFDPARQVEYDNQSFCPDIRNSPEIMALLKHPPVWKILETTLGTEKFGHAVGQIAIRKAHNADREYDPEPHIDGIPTPHNGVPGTEIMNFSALIGVFLTEVNREFAGNFTVWPGSHLLLEQHFRQRGPQAIGEGMPRIELGNPLQLHCSPGDVVFCHYQLAHSVTVNLSSNDRYAVYFRIWLNDLGNQRWKRLTNIWDGWQAF
jgi:hypothetical protein